VSKPNAEYAKYQFQVFQAYVMYWNAIIVSGGYKHRKYMIGCKKDLLHPDGWRTPTDEEKLADALETMNRHIHHMSESAEVIGAAQEEV